MTKTRSHKRLFYILALTFWMCESILLAQTDPGIITTVVGDDTGYSGDGGPATMAELFWPAGIFVDALDNYYIADFGNARIRKVDPGGTITSVAGNGFPDFSAMGIRRSRQACLPLPACSQTMRATSTLQTEGTTGSGGYTDRAA